jgi:hypothetical protein
MPDRPPLIGATIERHLETVLWRLVDGDLDLTDLAPALRAWWLVAYDQGRASRQPEVDRLSAECDRLHLIAYNTPEQVRDIYIKRMDEGALRYWSEWCEGLHDQPQQQHAQDAAA